MIRAFGVAIDHRGFRGVARRSTFLVDETGVVRAVFAYETSDVPDVEEWLDACRALNITPGSG